MKIAWFRPAPLGALDHRVATAFQTELSRHNVVDTFDERTAHEFVWKQFRAPYDVCLYELAPESRYRFVRAYLFHYPGVLLAHDLAAARHAIAASRLVVVNSVADAELLALDVTAERIHVAPQFAPAVAARDQSPRSGAVRVGVLDHRHRELMMRALDRARAAGADATLVDQHDDIDRLIRESDVLIALQGPRFSGPLMIPLLGMSAGRPVIVSETAATADWPALDPQTWVPRGYSRNDPPVVVSIDPRDEEHSLMLAIRRLSADASLRARLGTEARRWWERRGTPAQAAERWQYILEQGLAMSAPRSTLPAGVTPDGTSVARRVLEEFGVSVDLFDT